MKRRVIKLIITEDMIPETEDQPLGGESCSQGAYRFTHNGREYGTYVTIDKPFLTEDEIVEMASALVYSALEAYKELEKEKSLE